MQSEDLGMWMPKVVNFLLAHEDHNNLYILYLYDKQTNAHFYICSNMYFYSSPICYSHSCDFHVMKCIYKCAFVDLSYKYKIFFIAHM